jgi:hypothetical protein
VHAAAAEAEAKVASLTAALSAAKDDMAALQETVKLQAAELARHQARIFFCNSFNLRIRGKKIKGTGFWKGACKVFIESCPARRSNLYYKEMLHPIQTLLIRP